MGGPAAAAAFLPYIVVIGGSYVGTRTAQLLAPAFHKTHRVLLIEKNSHFQHIFAFPRYSVTSGSIDSRWTTTSGSIDGTGQIDTRRAFIPFNPGTFKDAPPDSGRVLHAKAIELTKSKIKIDKTVELDGNLTDEVPYEYLIIATGAKYTPPSTLPTEGKIAGIEYLRNHAALVERSKKIVIIGGGAVGVQLSTDIKELFPEKEVTLVHSRKQLMNNFHHGLHELIEQRANQLGLKLVLGHRVDVPENGYPNDGTEFNVKLLDGGEIPADLAIVSTGQTPSSQIVKTLAPHCVDSKGFVNVKQTLQIDDDSLPNVFALGDVANTGAHKAARPGFFQADTIVKNIQSLLDGQTPSAEYNADPPGIHLSLGINDNVIFSNPRQDGTEPRIVRQDNGRLDMSISDVWKRRAVGEDYHL